MHGIFFLRVSRILVPVFFIPFFLAACSSDDGTALSNDGLLDAPSGTLIRDAVPQIDIGDTYTPEEVSVDEFGTQILRTKLEIVFKQNATVDEVNELLVEIDASITSSIAGTRSLVIRIPDPGDLDALDAVVADIESQVFVWFVKKALLPDTTVVPSNIDGSDSASRDFIHHHLAIHAHGLWNALSAMTNKSSVVIQDFFGDGGLDTSHANYDGDTADFATLVPADPSICTNPTPGNKKFCPSEHGYHVMGIIAGAFGGSKIDDREFVTGMNAFKSKVDVVDLKKSDPLDGDTRMLLDAFNSTGTVVVNTSLSRCKSGNPLCMDDISAIQHGVAYAEKVRELGLEGRMLHVTAAANVKPSLDVRDATNASDYSRAALRTDLVDEFGEPVEPLTNVLVVENDIATNTETDPYEVECLNESSFINGNIGAIGTDVWSFIDADSDANDKTGTSMATPQVAGLAAALLAINPGLTPQQLITILQSTAKPVAASTNEGCSDAASPAPIIDAYAAVLSLDLFDSNLPVRRAILDFDGANGFDKTDLEAYIAAYLDPIIDEDVLDYGRMDLNGDGYSGPSYLAADPFDLDLDGNYGMVTYTVNGELLEVDENQLQDFQILCYYAYSPIYADDPTERDTLLEPHAYLCGQPAASKLVYTQRSALNNADIYTANIDGSDITQITNSSDIIVGYGSITSTGEQIIYQRRLSNSDSQIWIANLDATGTTSVGATTSSDMRESNPKLSPDDDYIAYYYRELIFDNDGTYFGDSGNIDAFMSIDGTGKTLLSSIATGCVRFVTRDVWLPNSKLFFWQGDYDGECALEYDGTYNIYDVTSANVEGVPCTTPFCYIKDIKSHPSGNLLAIHRQWYSGNPSDPCDEQELFLRDLTTGSEQQITNFSINISCDDIYLGPWSPDGAKLLFTKKKDSDDSFDVYIYDVASSNTQTLFATTYDVNQLSFDWSTDSKKFVVELDFGAMIRIFNLDDNSIVDVQNGRKPMWNSNDQFSFYWDDTSGSVIYTIKADGTGRTPIITAPSGYGVEPVGWIK
jgi:Tol biopolymer transport system component